MKLGALSSFHVFGPKFHSPCSSFTAELGGCDKSAPCVERRSEFAAVSPSRKFANCPFGAFQPCPTCPHLLTNIQPCACIHILSTYWLTLTFGIFQQTLFFFFSLKYLLWNGNHCWTSYQFYMFWQCTHTHILCLKKTSIWLWVPPFLIWLVLNWICKGPINSGIRSLFQATPCNKPPTFPFQLDS